MRVVNVGQARHLIVVGGERDRESSVLLGHLIVVGSVQCAACCLAVCSVCCKRVWRGPKHEHIRRHAME